MIDKIEMTQMPINRWLDKNVGYPYTGIFFDNEKGWNTDTCYNTDKPGHILLHERSQTSKTACWMTPSYEMSRRGGLAFCWGKGWGGMDRNCRVGSSHGDGHVLDWMVVRVAHPCKFIKNHWLLVLPREHFMVCKLYLQRSVKNRDKMPCEKSICSTYSRQ